jgi:hypothetical protein
MNDFVTDEFKAAWLSATMKELAVEAMEDCFVYLDEIREHGNINMGLAAPLVADQFGLDKRSARKVLAMWRHTFSDMPALERARKALQE